MINGRVENVPYSSYAKLKTIADGLSGELNLEKSKVSSLEHQISVLNELVETLKLKISNMEKSSAAKKEEGYDGFEYEYTNVKKKGDGGKGKWKK